MFLALEFSAAAKSPLRAEIQTAPSSSPPFSEEQLPLMGQDVATDGGGGSRGCSVRLSLPFLLLRHFLLLLRVWQQLASDAAGTPILEKVLLMSRHFPGTGFSSLNHRDQDSWRWRELQGSTTDLQPWSVRCVNKFILKASSTRSGQLSPASLLQVPTGPSSLDGCPGTSRSRRWSRFAVL